MTVGEKIQFYRKEHHLSQEELGQKLLVSRQTVSLWEMDKTMPTVDNLLLLKEIFGVTVDELLSSDEPAEEKREAGAEAIAAAHADSRGGA
jgi:transcriptional regulator with XRE-family HTH domain